jgi:hypothetical protein
MKIFKIVTISAISLVALVAAVLFSIGFFKPKPGGIKINTNPSASVYINGNFVGKSPYQGMYPAGKISLKLVPDASGENLIPFETNVTLISGIETVVGRNFGSSEDKSSGYVVSFEKSGGTDAGLVVVSRPDNAQISIDGVSRGFAPFKIGAITPAMHQITVRAPGYIDNIMSVKTLSGYRLAFFAKLEKDGSSDAGSAKTSSPEASLQKQFVQILSTPTGFLRVRTKPGASGEEIAEVKPGETYPYLATDLASGWFEIQYQEPKAGLPSGITGWVSGDYSKIITQMAGSTPSATIN